MSEPTKQRAPWKRSEPEAAERAVIQERAAGTESTEHPERAGMWESTVTTERTDLE